MTSQLKIELRKEIERCVWYAKRQSKRAIKEGIHAVNNELKKLEDDPTLPSGWGSVGRRLQTLSFDLANKGIDMLHQQDNGGWQYIDESIFFSYYALRFEWISSQRVAHPFDRHNLPIQAAKILCAAITRDLESVAKFSANVIRRFRETEPNHEIWSGRRDLELTLLYLLDSELSISKTEMGVYAECVSCQSDRLFSMACDAHIQLLREMYSVDDMAALASPPINVLPWDAEAIARLKNQDTNTIHELTEWAPSHPEKSKSIFENRFEPMMLRMEMVLPSDQP